MSQTLILIISLYLICFESIFSFRCKCNNAIVFKSILKRNHRLSESIDSGTAVNQPVIDQSNKNESLAEFIALVMNSIDEDGGKTLIDRGITVEDIDKDDVVTLNDKINNGQLSDQILGLSTYEDQLLLNQLKKYENDLSKESYGYDEDTSIDNDIINQIRVEAKLAVENLRESKLLFKDLLDDKKIDSNDLINKYDKTVTKQLLSDLNKEYHEKIDHSQSNSESKSFEERVQKTLNNTIDETVDSPSSSQTVIFSQLLKATIADTEAKIYASRNIDQSINNPNANEISIEISDNNVNQLDKQISDYISSGNIDNLDTKSLIGETLSTLTSQLGIDVKNDILTSDKTKLEMQAIMANSMVDLAKSLKDIDTERDQLISRLNNLSDSIRIDNNNQTSIPNNITSDQLDQLLPGYVELYEKELLLSKMKLDNATKTLSKALVEYEYNVGPLTAIALFQSKTIDKKLAFLFGLTLFFKVPFDLLKVYLSDSSIDFTSGFSLTTQALLCLALFTHYGLFAAWVTFKK